MADQLFDFADLIAERTSDFVGRAWVFAAIDGWLSDPLVPRFFVITGPPGSGKTAVAAQITRRYERVSCHFCSVHQYGTISPGMFVQSLAHQLARTLPRLSAQASGPELSSLQLETDTSVVAGQAVGVSIRHLASGDPSPEAAFFQLGADVSRALDATGFDGTLLIVVDGLDEATSVSERPTIVDLLGQLPAWPAGVRCIVTSRPGPHLKLLDDATHLSLDTSASQEDIAHFAQQTLRSLAPAEVPTSDEGMRDAHVLRTWFWQRVDRWLGEDGPAHFLAVGPPGSGKSTLVRDLEQMVHDTDALPRLGSAWTFVHTCHAGDGESQDPVRFVERLAVALAAVHPVFALALAGIQPTTQISSSVSVGTAAPGVTVKGIEIGALQIGLPSGRAAFEQSVRRPLDELCAAGTVEILLIVVDGLDEAGTTQNALAELIRHYLQPEARLPPQVRWLLTSRPDPRVLYLIGPPALDLSVESAGRDDVELYAHERLVPLSAVERTALARRLAHQAAGNFLYARFALDDALRDLAQGHPWTGIVLPDGLDDFYRRSLRRELAERLADWQTTYRPLLGALAVAQGGGLTLAQLAGILGRRAGMLQPALAACAQYLVEPKAAEPWRIFHESFREFLLRDTDFGVNPSEAHELVAVSFLETYQGAWEECEDSYALRHTPAHLIAALRDAPPETDQRTLRNLAGKLTALANADDFWSARRNAGLIVTVTRNGEDIQRTMLRLWSSYRLVRPVLEPLLGVLLTARAPMTARQLAAVCALEAERVIEGIDRSRAVLEEAPRGVYRIADPAVGQELGHQLREAPQANHRRFSAWYLANYAQRWTACDDYGLSWLITHLVGAEDWTATSGTLADEQFWRARIERVGVAAARDDLEGALALAPSGGLLGSALHALRQLLEVGAAVVDPQAPSNHRPLVAAILREVERIGISRVAGTAQLIPAAIAARVTAQAEGNFLYARYLLAAIQADPTSAERILEQTPAGLGAVYREQLWRLRRDEGEQRWHELYRPLLEVLTVAREPLTLGQLAAITGVPEHQVVTGLERLVGFLALQQGDTTYVRFAHHSLEDFLTDPDESQDFWIDARSAHRCIVESYYARFAGTWADCDSYGLRHLATHIALAAMHRPAHARHADVEELVAVTIDPGFQQAYLDHVADPLGLADDLALVVRTAASDVHAAAPVTLTEAVLRLTDLRTRLLSPAFLVDTIAGGAGAAALRYLEQYPVDPPWSLVARWLIAWTTAATDGPVSRMLAQELALTTPGSAPLAALHARVKAEVLGAGAPSLVALPPAPPAAVAAALGHDAADISTPLLGGDHLIDIDVDEPTMIAERDATLLTAFAVVNPGAGAAYLRHLLDRIGTSLYPRYRDLSLTMVLDAILRHPDPRWSREMALHVLRTALVRPEMGFPDARGIAHLALQAHTDARGAFNDACHRAESDVPPGPAGNMVREHQRRRLAACAEASALALDDSAVTHTLLRRARALPSGFAGFAAPALLSLADSTMICGGDTSTVAATLHQALAAAHNVQDALLCATLTARCNALAEPHDWSGSGLPDVVARFVDHPDAAEFAPYHRIGETYAWRDPTKLPLPDHLRRMQTLREMASALGLPLFLMQRLNPTSQPDEPLGPGTHVALPDRGIAPLLASRLSALVVVEPSLSRQERIWLVQSLIPPAMLDPMALDSLLARLTLVSPAARSGDRLAPSATG